MKLKSKEHRLRPLFKVKVQTEDQNSRCWKMSSQDIQHLADRNNSPCCLQGELLGEKRLSSTNSCQIKEHIHILSIRGNLPWTLAWKQIKSAITSSHSNTEDKRSFLIKKIRINIIWNLVKKNIFKGTVYPLWRAALFPAIFHNPHNLFSSKC